MYNFTAKTIQIQTILYNNSHSDIKYAIQNLANAIKIAKENKLITSVRLVYGDCSPTAVFTEQDLANIKTLDQNSYIDEIEYYFFDANLGSAAGHNRLLKTSTSEFLLIINPDVVVSPDLFVELIKAFNKSPNIGIVEARQIPVEHPKDYNLTTGETSWASTACALTSTEIARDINGFDEKSFFLYCDDVDFSWRVKIAGYKVIFQPTAIIFHDKRVTNNAGYIATESEKYYSAEAALILAHKYSRPDLVKLISVAFRLNGEEHHKKALEEFNRRAAEGLLPAPIDADHRVAQFKHGNYADHRWR